MLEMVISFQFENVPQRFHCCMLIQWRIQMGFWGFDKIPQLQSKYINIVVLIISNNYIPLYFSNFHAAALN